MKTNRKILILLMCVIVLFVLVFNMLLSFNIEHISVCHKDKCLQCSIIYQAQNFVKDIMIIFVIFYFNIIYEIFRNFNIKRFISITLVNSKVQLNE